MVQKLQKHVYVVIECPLILRLQSALIVIIYLNGLNYTEDLSIQLKQIVLETVQKDSKKVDT